MHQGVNAVIIDDENRVLILKRSNKDTKFYPGFWNFPGGSVEQNESLVDAVKREAKEETDLTVQPENNYFAVYYYPSGKKEDAEAVVYSFKAKFAGGTVVFDEDPSEFAWLSKDDYKKFNYNYTPSCKGALEKLFK